MADYRFRQAYAYGDDWDGELKNIPENATFYRCNQINEKQEEWYIVMYDKEHNIKKNDDFDWSEKFRGDGCAQVRFYNLLELRIIHLHDIKPYGEWPDVGEELFAEIYDDFFRNTYVTERTSGRYEVEDLSKLNLILDDSIPFKVIEEPRVASCYRLRRLTSFGEVECTAVTLYNPISRTELYGISDCSLCISDLQEGSYDPLKLKRSLTHSCLEYEDRFNTVVEILR